MAAHGERSGFRCRAALRTTVEQAAQRYANETGQSVHVFGVMGGYEGRSVDRGEPAGSHTLLAVVDSLRKNDKKKRPLGQPAPVVIRTKENTEVDEDIASG